MVSRSTIAILCGLAFASAAPANSDEQTCVLIREGLGSERITLVQISRDELRYLDSQGSPRSLPRERCLGVYDPAADTIPESDGLLVLADGQRLPGQAISNEALGEEVVAWNHMWLGRLNVPLRLVRAMRLKRDVRVLEPGDTDQVQLINGDLIQGYVVSLGDPIGLEIETEDGTEVIDVPMDRAAAVAMVTPAKPSRGQRVWLRDGTVIDVGSVIIDAEGQVRVDSPWLAGGEVPAALRIEHLAAILFDARGMVPLARLAPQRVSGPPFRYQVPAPRLLDERAPLGLSAIELRGPLVVHYALPPGARRLATEARLPDSAREWADFELVVRDDDEEVYRVRLDADHPVASINVPLSGSELTFRIVESGHGPVQDRVVLERAMILVE